MRGSEIRSKFIQFFKDKSHSFIDADSIAPLNDPTLLFTNAGMNQFKDYFLGKAPDDLKRAVNSQPCIRVSGKHNDLEDVGYDGTHQTLFEMLGNWSFGDFYKKEIISWSWEFLTKEMGIPGTKLYATVYETDDESEALWKSETSIPHAHILRFGKKDNFWEMGEVGPCGPCSEIHVDLEGEGDVETATDPILGVNGENGRFIEFWNLVFIQYERQEDGTLVDLPSKHVDTGMGLERLTAYMQGKATNYETDLLFPLIEKIASLSGVSYDAGEQSIPHRVMADHIRTLVFAITDNVMPSNEGRGYVLRRLLRRALRYAKNLGFQEPVLYSLVPIVIDMLGGHFKTLTKRSEFVSSVIKAEEESFLKTLDSGIDRFDEIVSNLTSGIIPGNLAFKLYDTYGFPVDLTQLLAKERGFTVDFKGFDQSLNHQREQSRSAQSKSVYVSDEEQLIDIDLSKMIDLHHSPNQGVARGGEAKVVLSYDDKIDMACHHTATHLIHEGLRRTLGNHVEQAGSSVDTDRLRFDFTHFESVSSEQLFEVEKWINSQIKLDLPVDVEITTLEDAKNRGAMALFGEKYDPEFVRLVSIAGESIELCGGTHVTRLSMLGSVKIVSESAVSSGVRRIEALAGQKWIDAYQENQRKILLGTLKQRVQKMTGLIDQIQRLDGSFQADEANNFQNLDVTTLSDLVGLDGRSIQFVKQLEKTLKQLQSKYVQSGLDSFMEDIDESDTGTICVFAQYLDHLDVSGARSLLDKLTEKYGNLVGIVALNQSGKGMFVIKCGKQVDLTVVSAQLVVEKLSGIAGGGGGGRPNMAQAGGADLDKVDLALTEVKQFLLTY